jgi:hypothetical protein
MNETKSLSFIPKSAPLKEIMSIWSRRTDSGPNRNNLFSTRQICECYKNVLVSFPKQYQNVCLSLLTLLRHSVAWEINFDLGKPNVSWEQTRGSRTQES